MPTVGIIGGMGPEATLDLFQKIIAHTPANRDQDHLHVLVDNDPSIPDRTAFLLGEGPSPLPQLLKAANRLVDAGAKVLCMPCNTAHYFIDELRAEVPVPIISIIESCQEDLQCLEIPVKRVGLLATRGTYRGRVYHRILEQSGMNVLPVDDLLQAKLMDVIYSVKSGKRAAVRSLFAECIDHMTMAQADVIVAGCTEIPLMLGDTSISVPVIDPTLALARSVVRHCQERKRIISDEAV